MIPKQSKPTTPNKVTFVFNKTNYQLLVASMAIVLLGFILMIGETDIYSFRKIVLAPILILGGFVFGFYAILKKPATDK